jgi:hypothetical protein
METFNSATSIRVPWNKAKLVGQKAPFKLKEIWAVQLLLGHSKLESTVRYLGIEVDDALEMAEQTDV